MNEKIPSYPVVHVTVRSDGSAHVNAAGSHVDYPPRDLHLIRAEVIAYAVTVAGRLGRAVRMTTTDPDGEWVLGVYPDGQVVDLNPAPAKGRTGPAKPQRTTTQRPVLVERISPPSPSTAPTAVLERTAEVTVLRPTPPARDAPSSGTPVATLTFSTGEVAMVVQRTIIGRKPESAGDPAEAQLVTITDPERNVSRTHLEVEWVHGILVATDRGSGNGTTVVREPGIRHQLAAGTPYELLHGDVLEVGTIVTCEVAVSYLREVAT